MGPRSNAVATTLQRSKGGQFVSHIQALPGTPYDGHTLQTVIPAIKGPVGATLTCIIADTGYKRHNAPSPTASKTTPPARSAVCLIRSNRICAGDRPLNPSSSTSWTTTA
ncbi:hypothetical protein M2360_000766 [Rhizobium sp. SG_E_25_P2]|nr:hypothetical protein [Rhizobium sp. SG_E_25_P2]